MITGGTLDFEKPPSNLNYCELSIIKLSYNYSPHMSSWHSECFAFTMVEILWFSKVRRGAVFVVGEPWHMRVVIRLPPKPPFFVVLTQGPISTLAMALASWHGCPDMEDSLDFFGDGLWMFIADSYGSL